MAGTRARDQLAAVKADIAQRERKAVAEWVWCQQQKRDLDGLRWAAGTEEALELAEQELDAQAAELEAQADADEVLAADCRARAGQLAPSARKLRCAERRFATVGIELEALGQRRDEAAVSGATNAELDRVEEAWRAKLGEREQAEAVLGELRSQAAESERLRAEAVGLAEQARVRRVEAKRLRVEVRAELPAIVAAEAAERRRHEARLRALRPAPSKPLSGADVVVPDAPTIEVARDGRLLGVAGLIRR